jgi:ABC-type nitrate/sulfonate/bicarbonate transport system substrate-binding protein
MQRRTFVTASLATASASLIAPLQPAGAAQNLRIGVAAVYPTYSIFTAAKELGYYSGAGLNVDIETFRGGPAAQEALAAGALDLCSIVPTAASLAIEKGVKEHIIALYSPPRPAGWYIVVPAASPIKTLAELNGKTVGVTQKGSLTDFWVQQVAKTAGISVTTIPLGGGVEPGLRAKQVDAAILWPLGSYKGLTSGELRSLADLESMLPATVSEGVAASDDLITNHPDVLRRWLAATSKALRYMQTHELWSVQFLKRYFDDPDDKTARMVVDHFINKIPVDGAMRPEWMRQALTLGAASGISTTLSVDRVFSTAFTPVPVR